MSLITIRMEFVFAFYLLLNTDIVNFLWKTSEGEAVSIVLLIFVVFQCLNRQWMKGGGVKQKVLFRANWNNIFFQLGF